MTGIWWRSGWPGWRLEHSVIPGWRPEIEARYQMLLRELGDRGLAQREGLGAAYIHGISTSPGEEFWLGQPDVDALEAVQRRRHLRRRGGHFFDYTARRTVLASSQPYICFALDDRFAITRPVALKVEFRDAAETSWRVEYLDTSGDLAATPAVACDGDGAVATATLVLNDARFANGLDHGMDFRIVCDGSGDVVVRWVRVVRLQRP
jgi:hypothetical protein